MHAATNCIGTPSKTVSESSDYKATLVPNLTTNAIVSVSPLAYVTSTMFTRSAMTPPDVNGFG